MPLLTQHSAPELTEEFRNLYAEVDGLRTQVAELTPVVGASPAVSEQTHLMPYFMHQVNFTKTESVVGAGVHHFEQWPIAVISGPYKLQSLELTVFYQDVVDMSHLVNKVFRIKQVASKRDWDISTVAEAHDPKEKIFAEWVWGETALNKLTGWNVPVNAADGDQIVLEFGSRVTPTAPAGSLWKYKAMIVGYYIPHDVVLFAEGGRI